MTMEIKSGATDTDKPMLLYSNLFEDGTITVSSETSDGQGANAIEDTTFDFWTPAVASASITVDRGFSAGADCLCIAAHDMATQGANFTLQTSTDGVTYTAIGVFLSPLTDDTIIVLFPLTFSRYWRFNIFNGPASIGVIKLGRRLVIDGGVISGHLSINHGKKIELLNSTSIGGQFLGNRIKRIGAETTIDFGLLERDFVDNDMAVFEDHYNSGRTFFYAGNPDFMPEDMGYCWRPERGGELSPTYEEGGVLMSVSMDVSAYVEQ
jgi:hypothetical protein